MNYNLIECLLNNKIEIEFDCAFPVVAEDAQSWIDDAYTAYKELTIADVETVLKWCNFEGTDEEVIMAAIKSLIIPEDLPLNCQLNINFNWEKYT
jgi:hypothetical protein